MRAWFIMALVTMIVGGWFYAHLYLTAGTTTAFNETPQSHLSLPNQPRSFYTDLALDRLCSDPIRPMFHNKFVPQFYAETWGNYFAYFLVYGRQISDGAYVFDGLALEEVLAQNGGVPPEGLKTNRYEINQSLGWVNLVALPVSLLMIGAFVWSSRYFYQWLTTSHPSPVQQTYALFWLLIVITWVGYGIFLIMFPYERGATIKATYILHVFPFLALLCAEFLEQVRVRFPKGYYLLAGMMGFVFLFVLPACFTRYAVSPLTFW